MACDLCGSGTATFHPAARDVRQKHPQAPAQQSALRMDEIVQKFWPWFVAIMELQDVFPVSHLLPASSTPGWKSKIGDPSTCST